MIDVGCNICGKKLKGFNFDDKYTKVVIRRHKFLMNYVQDDFYLCDKCAKKFIKNLKGKSVDLLDSYEEEPKTPNEIRAEKDLDH